MIIELLIGLALVWAIAYLLRQNRQLQIELDAVRKELDESQRSDKFHERKYAEERSKRVTLEECQKLQAAEVDRLRKEKGELEGRLKTRGDIANRTMQRLANTLFQEQGIVGGCEYDNT